MANDSILLAKMRTVNKMISELHNIIAGGGGVTQNNTAYREPYQNIFGCTWNGKNGVKLGLLYEGTALKEAKSDVSMVPRLVVMNVFPMTVDIALTIVNICLLLR